MARVSNTQKKLTSAREMEIKGWVTENCPILLKTISDKCMQESCVRICKSTAENIFVYTEANSHSS
ncbi:hypothetical protein HZS_1935 [Henneguya salminicola]|nr:hypothetical protein HZS_1935 [Henneguya salminicola]